MNRLISGVATFGMNTAFIHSSSRTKVTDNTKNEPINALRRNNNEQRLINKSRMRFLKNEIGRLSQIEQHLEHRISEERNLQLLRGTALGCLTGRDWGENTTSSSDMENRRRGTAENGDYITALLSLRDIESSSSLATTTLSHDKEERQSFSCTVSRLAALCSPPAHIDPVVAQRLYTLPNLLASSRQNKTIYKKVKFLLEKSGSAPASLLATKLARNIEKLRRTAVFDFASLEQYITATSSGGNKATSLSKRNKKRVEKIQLEKLWSRDADVESANGKSKTKKANTSTNRQSKSKTITLIGAIQRHKTHKVLNH